MPVKYQMPMLICSAMQIQPKKKPNTGWAFKMFSRHLVVSAIIWAIIVIIGGVGELIVTTVCEPQADGSTRIAVIATSTDSSTAELARNRIRERIVNAVVFDEGSALNPVNG